MKRVLVFLIFAFSVNTRAQDSSVEKRMFSVQAGFGSRVSLEINNESRLSNTIALKSSFGLENDFTVGDHYEGTGFILQPLLSLEPRYYYNLLKRNSKGKNTSYNSGNYFAIKTVYHPDWFVINLDDNVTKTADLAIIPTWGVKRQVASHFTFETAIGFGLRKVYLKDGFTNGNVQNVDGARQSNQYVPYLNLGIGYVFK